MSVRPHRFAATSMSGARSSGSVISRAVAGRFRDDGLLQVDDDVGTGAGRAAVTPVWIKIQPRSRLRTSVKPTFVSDQ